VAQDNKPAPPGHKKHSIVHFDRLFKLRIQIAKNTGSPDFLDFIFKAKGRFDYTRPHCREFHESIEKIVLPYQRELYKRRAQKMNLTSPSSMGSQL
jgi:oligoendopeptidase F